MAKHGSYKILSAHPALNYMDEKSQNIYVNLKLYLLCLIFVIMLTTMIKIWHSKKSINLPKVNTMIRVHLQAISHNIRRNYVIIMKSQHKHQTHNKKKDIKPTRSFVALHRSKDEDDSFVVCRCIHGINLVFDDIGLKKKHLNTALMYCIMYVVMHGKN